MRYILNNLLVNSFRTHKLFTSATGLRPSMATYTSRSIDQSIERERERREREVFMYSTANLILDHSL